MNMKVTLNGEELNSPGSYPPIEVHISVAVDVPDDKRARRYVDAIVDTATEAIRHHLDNDPPKWDLNATVKAAGRSSQLIDEPNPIDSRTFEHTNSGGHKFGVRIDLYPPRFRFPMKVSYWRIRERPSSENIYIITGVLGTFESARQVAVVVLEEFQP